jgi:hypothetical protein
MPYLIIEKIIGGCLDVVFNRRLYSVILLLFYPFTLRDIAPELGIECASLVVRIGKFAYLIMEKYNRLRYCPMLTF